MAFAVKCSYLFALISSISCLDEHYTITRTSAGSLLNEVDKFNVPESQCTSSVSQCSDYNSAQSSATGSACVCNCLPTASTFGHHEGSWSCMNNTEIRVQSGCKFKFTSEHDGDAFRILKNNESPLPIAVLPSLYCTIDMTSSKYFTCDGTWAELDPDGTTTSPLVIFIKSSLSSSRSYKFSFTVRTPASMKGKLISLQFKCRQRFQTSCLVFKMEGKFKCPVTIFQDSSTKQPAVKSTTLLTTYTSAKPSKTQGAAEEEGKRAANQGERGTSSGTIAAVVVIVFLAILLAAGIGFIIWKRKRGENMWIIDRLARLRKGNQLEPDENMYAEIAPETHERPTLTRTDALTRGINNCSFEDSSPTHLQQYDDSLYAEASFATTKEPAVTDSEGYLMPVDSPLYLELQPPKSNTFDGKNKQENAWLNSLPDGDSEASDSHSYDVLEDPNDHNTNSNAVTTSPECDIREQSCRGSVGSSIDSPTASTRPSVADSKGPVAKKRRRPPSPPRKGQEVLSSSDKDNTHDRLNTRTDHHGTVVGNGPDCKANIYESLKEDERVMSIYEPLDKTDVNI